MGSLRWVVLLLCIAETARADYFLRRYEEDATCSLETGGVDAVEDRCQYASDITTPEAGSLAYNKRIMMRFGETNCAVTLKQCRANVCYRIYDLTGRIETDQIDHPVPSSFFTKFEIVGGTLHSWDRYGITFSVDDTGAENGVTLQYSTATCSEFYFYRGREKQQRCSDPVAALTQVSAGFTQDCLDKVYEPPIVEAIPGSHLGVTRSAAIPRPRAGDEAVVNATKAATDKAVGTITGRSTT